MYGMRPICMGKVLPIEVGAQTHPKTLSLFDSFRREGKEKGRGEEEGNGTEMRENSLTLKNNF